MYHTVLDTTMALSSPRDCEIEIIKFFLDVESDQLKLLLLYILEKKRKKRLVVERQRAMWVRKWMLRRGQLGMFDTLMKEMVAEDPAGFKNLMRMDREMFQEILNKVAPLIVKKDTFWRESISPAIRLAITLRFLATGDSYLSLQYAFRVANNTICQIIPETCEAIIEVFQEELIQCPTTPEGWIAIADQYSNRWQFHHCIGAIDGKHIAIRCPPNAGSLYYNYKGFHSLVLMAVVDADYKFIYTALGSPGSASDGGVFLTCLFSSRRYININTLTKFSNKYQ